MKILLCGFKNIQGCSSTIILVSGHIVAEGWCPVETGASILLYGTQLDAGVGEMTGTSMTEWKLSGGRL